MAARSSNHQEPWSNCIDISTASSRSTVASFDTYNESIAIPVRYQQTTRSLIQIESSHRKWLRCKFLQTPLQAQEETARVFWKRDWLSLTAAASRCFFLPWRVSIALRRRQSRKPVAPPTYPSERRKLSMIVDVPRRVSCQLRVRGDGHLLKDRPGVMKTRKGDAQDGSIASRKADGREQSKTRLDEVTCLPPDTSPLITTPGCKIFTGRTRRYGDDWSVRVSHVCVRWIRSG
jgi:hypothetical protein